MGGGGSGRGSGEERREKRSGASEGEDGMVSPERPAFMGHSRPVGHCPQEDESQLPNHLETRVTVYRSHASLS